MSEPAPTYDASLATELIKSGWSVEAAGLMAAYPEPKFARYLRRRFLNTKENAPRTPTPPRPYIPERIRWLVWERDDFRCQECGVRRYLSVDHIVPLSRGGITNDTNFQTLCRSCNSRKGVRQ